MARRSAHRICVLPRGRSAATKVGIRGVATVLRFIAVVAEGRGGICGGRVRRADRVGIWALFGAVLSGTNCRRQSRGGLYEGRRRAGSRGRTGEAGSASQAGSASAEGPRATCQSSAQIVGRGEFFGFEECECGEGNDGNARAARATAVFASRARAARGGVATAFGC